MTVCDSTFADDDDGFNKHRGASGASGASGAWDALGASGTEFEDIVAGLSRPSPWDEVDATGAAESGPATDFTSPGFSGRESVDTTTAPTGDSTGATGGSCSCSCTSTGAGAFVFGPGFTLPESMSRDGDLARLIESFTRFTDSYVRSFPFSRGVLEDDVEAASQDRLLDLIDVVSAHQRQLSAALAVIAQEVAHRSRGELMDQRLDFQYGYKSPSQFFADCVQIERRDALALTKLGQAIIGERALTGERLQAKNEVVADAVRAGELGFAHANDIVRLTEKLGEKATVDPEEVDEGEQLLVDIACQGLPLKEFRAAIAHLEGYLDPDGVAPTIEAQRRQNSVTFRKNQDTGILHMNGKFDAESGAMVLQVFEAYVTATLRASRGNNHPDGLVLDPDHPDATTTAQGVVTRADGSDQQGRGNGRSDLAADADPATHPAPDDAETDDTETDGAGVDDAAAQAAFLDGSFRNDSAKDPYRRDQVAGETRSIPQIQADAMVDFAKHIIGCDLSKLPGPSMSVVVRMGLEDFLPPEALAELQASISGVATGDAAAGCGDCAGCAGAKAGADGVDTSGTGDDRPGADNHTHADADFEGSAGAGHPGAGAGDAVAGDPAAAFRPPEASGCMNTNQSGMSYPNRVLTGIATIDGAAGGTIIDVGTARRIAAAAGIIPIVLGYDSVVLDLGREVRHFTRGQRLALIERDGGCAFCGLPPGMTEAHHMAYWTAHGGKTDLDNGILLCSSCHRRVHAGWEIRIVHDPAKSKRAAKRAKQRGGGTVWFIPPANVDPLREPRLGGRKRFDLGYRKEHPPVPIPGYENAPWDTRGPTFRPKA